MARSPCLVALWFSQLSNVEDRAELNEAVTLRPALEPSGCDRARAIADDNAQSPIGVLANRHLPAIQ